MKRKLFYSEPLTCLVGHEVGALLNAFVTLAFLVLAAAGVFLSAGFCNKSDARKSDEDKDQFTSDEAIEGLDHELAVFVFGYTIIRKPANFCKLLIDCWLLGKNEPGMDFYAVQITTSLIPVP